MHANALKAPGADTSKKLPMAPAPAKPNDLDALRQKQFNHAEKRLSLALERERALQSEHMAREKAMLSLQQGQLEQRLVFRDELRAVEQGMQEQFDAQLEQATNEAAKSEARELQDERNRFRAHEAEEMSLIQNAWHSLHSHAHVGGDQWSEQCVYYRRLTETSEVLAIRDSEYEELRNRFSELRSESCMASQSKEACELEQTITERQLKTTMKQLADEVRENQRACAILKAREESYVTEHAAWNAEVCEVERLRKQQRAMTARIGVLKDQHASDDYTLRRQLHEAQDALRQYTDMRTFCENELANYRDNMVPQLKSELSTYRSHLSTSRPGSAEPSTIDTSGYTRLSAQLPKPRSMTWSSPHADADSFRFP